MSTDRISSAAGSFAQVRGITFPSHEREAQRARRSGGSPDALFDFFVSSGVVVVRKSVRELLTPALVPPLMR